jgi:hypothetical protein
MAIAFLHQRDTAGVDADQAATFTPGRDEDARRTFTRD